MRHELSNIKIEKVNPENGLIGFCDFTVDKKIRFRGVAIFSRLEGGIRLSWPEKMRGLKKVKIVSLVEQEGYADIESQVLEAMNNEENQQCVSKP